MSTPGRHVADLPLASRSLPELPSVRIAAPGNATTTALYFPHHRQLPLEFQSTTMTRVVWYSFIAFSIFTASSIRPSAACAGNSQRWPALNSNAPELL
eukprot:CAMPEP_0174892650 /NCGR_PEP_ID=MMETSP0167-20121228/7572_1 /TAXON_ID=38298 /ORGANISM="Rhodella maculata, Strain CCMP736" /LENGTH=97 /DNA_ID=CAMNT_0016131211 /DNA_START=115 /DNA_END=408 /DNA_ORIENTATION=-